MSKVTVLLFSTHRKERLDQFLAKVSLWFDTLSNIALDENGNYVIMLSEVKHGQSQESQPSECQENEKQVPEQQVQGPNVLSPEQKSSTIIWS